MSNSVLTGDIVAPFTLPGAFVAVTALAGIIPVPIVLGGLGTRYIVGSIPVPFVTGGKVGPISGPTFAFPEVVVEFDDFTREIIVDVDSEPSDNV